MSIAERAQAEQEYLVARRRDFHAHPEISMQEFRTAQRIEEELDKLGIPHQRSGATGVYAEIKGAKPGTGVIALRADIDALAITETHEVPYKSQTPGVMHACGHDSHAAALLGAAKILEAERQNFGGTIRLFFQPGEEIGKGAKEFIRDGHLDGVQRVFGLHAASDLPVGTIGVTPGSNNAAVDGFRIIVHGVNAHVSTPQLGADALYIASQIVVAAQALTTRRHAPTEPMVIGIGTLQAGTAYNIVAGHAELEGTTRTLTPETRAAVRQQLDALAKQTAALYGAEAEVGSGQTSLPLSSTRQRSVHRWPPRPESWTASPSSPTARCRWAATILRSISRRCRAYTPIWAPGTRKTPTPPLPTTTMALTSAKKHCPTVQRCMHRSLCGGCRKEQNRHDRIFPSE